MALNDSAGIDVEREDRSQTSINPLQSAIQVASVIISEKGLINRPQLILNDDKRIERFGLSNFSKYGSSATECSNILKSRIQMMVVRPGEDSWRLAGIKAQSTGLSASSGYKQSDLAVTAALGSDLFRIAAMGEGAWGNNLVIRFANLDVGELSENADNSRVKKLEIYQFDSPWTFSATYDDWTVKFKVTKFVEATDIYLQINGASSSKITIAANTEVKNIVSSLNSALTAMGYTDYEFKTKPASLEENESTNELELTTDEYNQSLNSLSIVNSNAESIVKVTRVSEGTFTDADSKIWAAKNSDKLVKSYYVSLNSDDLDDNGNTMYLTSVLKNDPYIYAICNEDAIGAIQTWTGVNALDFGDADWTTGSHPSVIALAGGCTSSESGADPAGFSTKMARALAAKNALNLILENNDTYRNFVTINAAHEISNSDFADLAKAANESTLAIDSLGKSVAMLDESNLIEGLMSGDIQVQHDTFLAHYWQWLEIKEANSGKPIFVSPASFIAKILGINAQNGQYARPPAGYNYGVITGADNISQNCKGPTRKTLGNYKVNAIKADSDGFVVWNCLTSQAANSSFSDVYVVMSFLAMKYGIKDNLKGFEFEWNDPETVSSITKILEGVGQRFVSAKYAQEIKVDNSKNVYGSEEILIYFNVRFKKAAKFLRIRLVAHPSDQSLAISLAAE